DTTTRAEVEAPWGLASTKVGATPATSTAGITCCAEAGDWGVRISAPPGVRPSRSVLCTCIASGAPSTETSTPRASCPPATDSSRILSSSPGPTTTWLRPAIAAGPSSVHSCTEAVAGWEEGLRSTSAELFPVVVEIPRKDASVVGRAQRLTARDRESPLPVAVDCTASATGRRSWELAADSSGASWIWASVRTLSPRSWAADSPGSAEPSDPSAVIWGARMLPSSSCSVSAPLTAPNSREDSGSNATVPTSTAGWGGVTDRSSSGPSSNSGSGGCTGPGHHICTEPGRELASPPRHGDGLARRGQRHQCDGRGQGNQAGQPQQGPCHAGAAGARFLVPILDATVRGPPRHVVVVAELVVVSHTSPPRRGCADA